MENFKNDITEYQNKMKLTERATNELNNEYLKHYFNVINFLSAIHIVAPLIIENENTHVY